MLVGLSILIGYAPQLFAVAVLPNTVTGLQLWLDANDINGDGTPFVGTTIGLWIDKSGNDNHAGQGLVNSQPTYISDGGEDFSNFSIVRFDGANDFMNLPGGLMFNEPAFTMIVMHKTPTGHNQGIIWAWR